MDTGEGRFIPIEEDIAKKIESFQERLKDEPLKGFEAEKEIEALRQQFPKMKGIFHIGEELEIKGSKFKVHDISPFGIKLRLLPQD